MNWEQRLLPEDHIVDIFLMQNKVPTMALNNFMIVLLFFSSLSSELNGCVDKESFNVYISLQQYQQNFENSYKDFLKDGSLKKFRFECLVSIINS
jgi:hypothetical protein